MDRSLAGIGPLWIHGIQIFFQLDQDVTVGSQQTQLSDCVLIRSHVSVPLENTLITISLVEARVVSPITADNVIPDVESSATGNNRTTEAGSQAAATVQTQTVTPGAAPGVAPSVVAA